MIITMECVYHTSNRPNIPNGIELNVSIGEAVPAEGGLVDPAACRGWTPRR